MSPKNKQHNVCLGEIDPYTISCSFIKCCIRKSHSCVHDSKLTLQIKFHQARTFKSWDIKTIYFIVHIIILVNKKKMKIIKIHQILTPCFFVVL